MEPLDERRLRRPEFRDGTGVVLADGQTWTFPRPWLRLYPVRTPDGSFTIGGGLGFDAEFEELADQFASEPSDDPVRKLEIQFRMAAGLLCRNYDLTDAHLRRLLAVDLDDPSSQECWARINEVLLGRVPKPSADGSAGPCS
jgi:hypothetical protein